LDIHVIGSNDLIIGFQLIGIKGTRTESPAEAKEKILELSKTEDIIFIIIENSIARELEDFLKEFKLKHLNIIITEIPGINEKLPDFDSSKLLKSIFG